MVKTRETNRKRLTVTSSFLSNKKDQAITQSPPKRGRKKSTTTKSNTAKTVTPSKQKNVVTKTDQGKQSSQKSEDYNILKQELKNLYHLYHTSERENASSQEKLKTELQQTKKELKEAKKEAKIAVKKAESNAVKLSAALDKNSNHKLEVSGLRQKEELKKREHSFKLSEETNKAKTLQSILKVKEREIVQLTKRVSVLEAERQKAAAFSMKQSEQKKKIEMR